MNRHPARPGFLRRQDARIKILALVAGCFVCQYLPDPLLPVWLAVLAGLFSAREMRTGGMLRMARGGLYFILFWLVMKLGSDLIMDLPWRTAIANALPLTGRLTALTLLGLAVVGLASPIEIGMAAAWFMTALLDRWFRLPALVAALAVWLYVSGHGSAVALPGLLVCGLSVFVVLGIAGYFAGPLIRRRVWKLALAVALTAWFLPLTLRLAGEVLAGMRARGLRLSWRQKAAALVGTSLRILERKADEVAAGLASRRLDDCRSWEMSVS